MTTFIFLFSMLIAVVVVTNCIITIERYVLWFMGKPKKVIVQVKNNKPNQLMQNLQTENAFLREQLDSYQNYR